MMWKTLAHEMLKQGVFLALRQKLTAEHPFLIVRCSSLHNEVILLHLKNRPESKYSTPGTEKAGHPSLEHRLLLLRSTEPSVKSVLSNQCGLLNGHPPVQVHCSIHVNTHLHVCPAEADVANGLQRFPTSRGRVLVPCTGDLSMPLNPVETIASVSKGIKGHHIPPQVSPTGQTVLETRRHNR